MYGSEDKRWICSFLILKTFLSR